VPKIYMEKRQALQQMLLGKPIYKKLKLDPCLSPCTSINSKWIKDLKIRPEPLKLVQERAGKDFLNKTPQLSNLKKDGQMGLHKILKVLLNKRYGL
jgi:hypothetical protein